MTILEALGDYLEAHGQGTLGVNIFLGRMQETPDACITLYEYEGASPIESMGSNPFDVSRPRIQVVCRAGENDYPVARDKAIAVQELLGGITEQTISTLRVMRVRALGSILPLGFDTQDRPTVAANFECFVER